MSYVISVGGDPINPNPFTYSSIPMTGNITLIWPSNTQNATYTATDWIDITSTAAYTVTMPPANEAGTGQEVVFYNFGSYTITINDAASGNITTVASGLTKRIWITDNSTSAGTWRIANIGTGTTSADASMLAGYGLIAQAGQLSQSMPVSDFGTDATLNAGYRSYLALWTGGAGTLALTSPATLGSNWFVNVKNAGSGIVTLDAGAAMIDSSSTIDVGLNEGFTVTCDGSNFYSTGRVIPETSGFTLITKSVAGNTDVTLTSTEAAYSIIYLTGPLTGNINVIVPSSVNEWVMFNNTSGAFTLTVKTAAGTGVAIAQATRRILNCDGTNVNFSDTVGTGTVTSIATGTGLTGGTITTSGTLSLANTAVVAGTYGSASAVPSLTVDAQGRLTAASSTPLGTASVENLSSVIIDNGAGALTIGAAQVTAAMLASSLALPGVPTVSNLAVDDNSSKIANSAYFIAQSASKANQQAASSITRFVSPGQQQSHPSAAKAWVYFTVSGTTPTISSSYNVTSVARQSAGIYRITFTTAFADTAYTYNITPGINTATTAYMIGCRQSGGTKSTTVFDAAFIKITNALDEPSEAALVFFGAQ